MIRKSDILDGIRIATPCHASWDAMDGDERVRFCGACRLNVYNISEMSRTDAEELVRKSEGRLCIRIYQRTDGTVITKDCPLGIHALKHRLSFAATAICALFLTAGAFASSAGYPPADEQSGLWDRMKARVHQVQPFKSLLDWLDPPAQTLTSSPAMGAAPTPVALGKVAVTMGEVAPSPRPTSRHHTGGE